MDTRMDYTLKATMNSPMVVQLLDGEIQVDEGFRLYPGLRIHTSLSTYSPWLSFYEKTGL